MGPNYLLEPAMALLGCPLFIIILVVVVVIFLLDPFPMARLQWDAPTHALWLVPMCECWLELCATASSTRLIPLWFHFSLWVPNYLFHFDFTFLIYRPLVNEGSSTLLIHCKLIKISDKIYKMTFPDSCIAGIIGVEQKYFVIVIVTSWQWHVCVQISLTAVELYLLWFLFLALSVIKKGTAIVTTLTTLKLSMLTTFWPLCVLCALRFQNYKGQTIG